MTVQFLAGDCRDILPTLPADSVHCVVTSPPYYGLRDYGTALWDGGDAACDHLRPAAHGYSPHDTSTLGPKRDGCSPDNSAHSDAVKRQQFRDTCGKCGAVRVDRQIGLEATPDLYLETMVQVFREVRRVLRRDGTCWVNMGDSYASAPPGTKRPGASESSTLNGINSERYRATLDAGIGTKRDTSRLPGIKPKDLLLMPARLALALQADGWWVRSDIIWAKPNPMPESCRDRPTSAHEHIFLLTKSARYFYDIDAVREPIQDSSIARLTQPNVLTQPGGPKDSGEGNRSHRKTLRNQAEKLIAHEKWKDRFEGWAEWNTTQGRNLRNVWEVSTEPFRDAHFATMPTTIVGRCIKAGTSERGCCAACGKPWVRTTERVNGNAGASWHDHVADQERGQRGGASAYRGAERKAYEANGITTTGWSPGCQCNGHFEERPAAADWISDETGERKTVRVWVPDGDAPKPVPCTVLDPFAGAGTTLLVADRLQRNAIGIELSQPYITMARSRLEKDAGLFASIAAD